MFKPNAFAAALAAAAAMAASAAIAPHKVKIGANTKVFTQSVTSTADGTLYAGSLTLGALFKAAPDAATAEIWVQKPADGPQAISGVFADEKSGILWACYADLGAFGGKGMPSQLKAIDLASGAVKGSYPFPDGSFCNDIATTADGTAYATDTAGSRIMRLKAGAGALEEWIKSDALQGIDGISFAGDGKLYVNSVMANKLMRIDIGADGAAGTVTDLTHSEPIKGPDGMRFGDDGVLYLAENGAGRVDAVTIAGDAATIKALKDGYDAPTAVTKVGSTVWVLEAKIGQLSAGTDPGQFYIWPVALGQ
jgi:sugar lactone lactonase YvrE